MSDEKIKGLVRGVVVSDKMMKSCSVTITRRVKHPIGKYITRSSKILIHDEENACKAGDTVTARPTRPQSKRKSWELVEIVERGH